MNASYIRPGKVDQIASFPFQGFQNMMQAGGHYSLFIIMKAQYTKL